MATPDYQSPVKVRWMRQAFAFLGPEWSDIGKSNTGLNIMLSSPLFRHPQDPNYGKLLSEFKQYGLLTTNCDQAKPSPSQATTRSSVVEH